MSTPTLRPLRVGEILDVSINIFTKNFLTFVRILLLLVVPVQLLTIIVNVSTIPDPDLVGQRFGNNSSVTLASDDVPAFVGGQVVVFVLSLILTAVATAACFKAVSDAYLGSRPNWRTSLKFAAKRFHSVLWVTIMISVLATIGLIALIVPGIWLWFSWAVAVPALLFEGCKGRHALSRSFHLVKGRWWATAGALLAAFLIAAIIGGILQGLVSALVFTDIGNSVLGASAVNAVANGIGQLFTTPFPAAVTAVVYYDLRVRKEGFDLQLLAERLGVTPQAGSAPPMVPTAGASVPVWERGQQGPPAGPAAYPPPPPPPPPPPGAPGRDPDE